MINPGQKNSAFDFLIYFGLPFALHLVLSSFLNRLLESAFLPSQKDSHLYQFLELGFHLIRIFVMLWLTSFALRKLSLWDRGLFEKRRFWVPLLASVLLGILTLMYAWASDLLRTVAFIGWLAWIEEFLFLSLPKFLFIAVFLTGLLPSKWNFWERLIGVVAGHGLIFLVIELYSFGQTESAFQFGALLMSGPLLLAWGVSQFYGIISGIMALFIGVFMLISLNYFDRLFIPIQSMNLYLVAAALVIIRVLNNERIKIHKRLTGR